MRGDVETWLNSIVSEHRSRFILGVDGLSRAGKTTFVKSLCEQLNVWKKSVTLFHLDDHIVERSKRYNTGFEPWYEYYQLQWDVEFLREALFGKLQEHVEVEIPFYIEEQDVCVVRRVSIPKETLIIVEGIFLQRPEWRGFCDFVVYLDSSRNTRFRRESSDTQSKVEKFQTRYWKAENYYLEHVQPMEKADIVLCSEKTLTL